MAPEKTIARDIYIRADGSPCSPADADFRVAPGGGFIHDWLASVWEPAERHDTIVFAGGRWWGKLNTRRYAAGILPAPEAADRWLCVSMHRTCLRGIIRWAVQAAIPDAQGDLDVWGDWLFP